MAEADDRHLLQSKRKAISTLLPYAVWQERDGQPEMFDTILRAVRASRMSKFIWHHVDRSFSTLLSGASPRAIVLGSPHIPYDRLINRRDGGNVIQRWATTASAVPYTEDIAQSVVDTLLQIASNDELLRHISVDVWSWLIKRPSLPPVCRGRSVGTCAHVVKAVRGLKDVELLKSYFLLVWSEWNGVLSDSSGSAWYAESPLTLHP